MAYLTSITVLWAFSFSLIGVYLAGQVDSWFSVFMRVALASLVFIPVTKFRQVPNELKLKLMAIGGIQLGLMYCFYYQSFILLSVPEVLLFTVFTPVYVTLIYDFLQGKFSPWYLVTAGVAVLGAIVIKQTSINENFFIGFLVVQGANICFAIGQVAYKHVMEKVDDTLPQRHIFGYFYFGAFVVAGIAFMLLGNVDKLPSTNLQWGVLVYLGVVASGLGYFLWNKGACRVNAGALAIMNNALVPAGLLVNVLIWNRNVDYLNLAIGGAIILFSLWLNETWIKRKVALSRS